MKFSHDSGFVRAHSLALPTSGSGRQASSGRTPGAAPFSDRPGPPAGSRRLSLHSRDAIVDGVRLAKIAEMREAILAGSFRVSAEAVADRMIVEASDLLETISSSWRT